MYADTVPRSVNDLRSKKESFIEPDSNCRVISCDEMSHMSHLLSLSADAGRTEELQNFLFSLVFSVTCSLAVQGGPYCSTPGPLPVSVRADRGLGRISIRSLPESGLNTSNFGMQH